MLYLDITMLYGGFMEPILFEAIAFTVASLGIVLFIVGSEIAFRIKK